MRRMSVIVVLMLSLSCTADHGARGGVEEGNAPFRPRTTQGLDAAPQNGVGTESSGSGVPVEDVR